MATKLFQKRVDIELLEDVSEIYASLGTSVGEAFVMFLKKSEEVRGLPFDLKQSKEYIEMQELEGSKRFISDYADKNAKKLDMSKKEDVAILFDEEW